jgi:hypothetical protein
VHWGFLFASTPSFALHSTVFVLGTHKKVMPDPLAISSAAVGFVAFALQVATTAADFVRDVKDFPQEFTKLSLVTNELAIHVRRLSPSIDEIDGRYQPGGVLPILYSVC